MTPSCSHPFRKLLIVAASLTVLFAALDPVSVLNALTSRKGLPWRATASS